MGTCPNCGAYVSPADNVCSCGTVLAGRSSVEEEKRGPTEFELQEAEKRRIRAAYSKEIDGLMDEGRYVETIEVIDRALDYSESIFLYRKKAIACYYLGRYEEALALFKKSFFPGDAIDNFVIYEWIGDTSAKMSRFRDAIGAYERSIDIINRDYERRMEYNRENRWSSPSDSYLKSLLDEKNLNVLEMEKRIAEVRKMAENAALSPDNAVSEEDMLGAIGRENLITITGTFFYAEKPFEKGMELKLVREPENEFDGDAIAVYLAGEKVGYAANSFRTCCPLTSMASDINISDSAYAEYILYYNHRYHIAKIKPGG